MELVSCKCRRDRRPCADVARPMRTDSSFRCSNLLLTMTFLRRLVGSIFIIVIWRRRRRTLLLVVVCIGVIPPILELIFRSSRKELNNLDPANVLLRLAAHILVDLFLELGHFFWRRQALVEGRINVVLEVLADCRGGASRQKLCNLGKVHALLLAAKNRVVFVLRPSTALQSRIEALL
jgi:hypothetical protein